MWNGADTAHAQALSMELDWLDTLLAQRLDQFFKQTPLELGEPAPTLPADSELARVHAELAALQGLPSLSREERLLLALALVPHLRPAALDLLYMRNQNLERGFTEFGGIKSQNHGGFMPTGETAAFLIAGESLARRFALLALFDPGHGFARRGLLRLEPPPAGEPQLSGLLAASPEALQRLSTGVWHKPDYNAQFPAKLIHSSLTWDDLVLAPEVLDDIRQLSAWLTHGRTLMQDWGLARSLKPGYRTLFYGPPGTGKTLTATLIGLQAKLDVYRIDLSMVVSKYIGETEKNLARVFDQAETRNWVLFFDEADALFGKRSAASNANDHHANQEIAYLLQRVEDFPGVVILASNLRGNLDEAFSRRFQSMVYFPMPDPEQRLRLWRGMLAGQHLAPDVRLDEIAQRYELSGGSIANVIRHAALSAMRQGRQQVRASELRTGLAKELRKEGRTL
ncbi:ATP-binding protein [Roseateles sp.]|uniref:ATP-binding protein n=1 Tax=Roseateles sp. TaxID=1971397 RepID=UPI003D0C0969